MYYKFRDLLAGDHFQIIQFIIFIFLIPFHIFQFIFSIFLAFH